MTEALLRAEREELVRALRALVDAVEVHAEGLKAVARQGRSVLEALKD